MDTAEALRSFDGKHVTPLEALAQELHSRNDGIDELLTLARKDKAALQTPATWVLKRLQELGAQFTKTHTTQVLDCLEHLEHWEARLHLLQMLDGLSIAPRNAAKANKRLKDWLEDPNKLVRAWTCSGLCVIADQHPKFRPEARALLHEAQNDAAASVRARLRKLYKSHAWLNDSEPMS